MLEPQFFLCKHCGNLAGMLHDAGVPMICCGEKMERLIPNAVEAAHEKHLPCVEIDGARITVRVGSVDHPMAEEHSIQWIYLASVYGGQRKLLKPGEAPVATFALSQDLPVEAYAYCNLHGLWKTAI